MSTLGERWRDLWSQLRSSPAKVPSKIAIPREHVDVKDRIGTPFATMKIISRCA